MNHEMRSRIIDLWSEDSYVYFNVNIHYTGWAKSQYPYVGPYSTAVVYI